MVVGIGMPVGDGDGEPLLEPSPDVLHAQTPMLDADAKRKRTDASQVRSLAAARAFIGTALKASRPSGASARPPV
jgi:hypothetical protein